MTESDILRIWNGPTSVCNKAKLLKFAVDYREAIVKEIIAKNAPEIEKINAALAKAQPAAVSESDDEQAFKPDALERSIDDYLTDYELRGDESCYTPNERELFLIKDAIMGLLVDEVFTDEFIKPIESRLRAESAQEPCAWRFKQHPGHSIWTYVDYFPVALSSIAIVEPLYAAPVAKPAAQEYVSVPRDSLKLAIEFLQFAQDVPTQEQRATELSAELYGLLAASESKT